MIKKIALSLVAIGLVSSLVGMASFALFSATAANQNNVFSSGTVTLGAPGGCANTYNNIAPGDTGTFTCSIQYTGSLDAWLGVDISATGDLNSGADALTYTISDGSKGYTANAANQVVGKVSSGTTSNLTANWSFPITAGNSYQGKQGQLALTFHAVQAKNNTNGANNGPVAWN